MADRVLELIIKTEVQKALKDLKKVDSTTDKTKKGFEGLKKSAGFAVGAFTAVAAAAAAVGVASIKSAAAFQKQKVAFEVMLGSASKANTLLKDIEKFSATTPFQMPGLIDGTKRLIAFGIAEDKVLQKMKNLGNAAMGNQETLNRLTDAYGKLRAKGKASLEELNRFSEAGVPILAELAKQFGVTTEEILNMVSKGKVGFEEVDEALTSLTTNGGKFAGMIDKMGQTTEGRFSTMLDNFNLAGKALGEKLLPIADDMIEVFTEFAIELQKNEDLMELVSAAAWALGEGVKFVLKTIKFGINILTSFAKYLGIIDGEFISANSKSRELSENYTKQAEEIEVLSERYANLRDKENKTVEEMEELEEITQSLTSLTNGNVSAIELQTSKIGDLNNILDKEIEKKKELATLEAKRAEFVAIRELAQQEKEYWEQVDKLMRAKERLAKAEKSRNMGEIDTQKMLLEQAAKKVDIAKRNISQLKEEKKAAAELFTLRFTGRPLGAPEKEEEKPKPKQTVEEIIAPDKEAMQMRLELWGTERENFIANIEERKEKYAKVLGDSVELEKWKNDQIAQYDMDAINQRHELATEEWNKKQEARELEMEAHEKAEEEKTEKTKKENEKRLQDTLSVAKTMYGSLTGMMDSMFAYRLSTMDEESKEYKETQLAQFNYQKATAAVNAGINTAGAVMKTLEAFGGTPLGIAAAAVVGGMGAAQIGFILSQAPPAFAMGGSFMTDGPQMVGGALVGDNAGGVERVDVTPVSSFGNDDVLVEQPIIIKIDSGPIYRGMLRASKDRILLIDKGALV